MFKSTVKVVGVTFSNPDGTSRQDILGAIYDDYWTEGMDREVKVELRPEPDNQYDPNAVAVWVIEPKEEAGQVGYLAAEVASSVSTAIEEGRLVSVEVDDMGTMRGAKIWMNLLIKLRGENEDKKKSYGSEHLFEDEDGETYKIVG